MKQDFVKQLGKPSSKCIMVGSMLSVKDTVNKITSQVLFLFNRFNPQYILSGSDRETRCWSRVHNNSQERGGAEGESTDLDG